MISFSFSAIITLSFNTKNPVIEFSIPGTAPDLFLYPHHYPQQYQVIIIGGNISFLRFGQDQNSHLPCLQEQFALAKP
jgi:hypothetical protein